MESTVAAHGEDAQCFIKKIICVRWFPGDVDG